jgi:hypothetical protein
VGVGIVSALAAGCGTQVSSGYLGESLLTLSGSVVVANAEAPSELVPVLAYERPRPGALPNAYLLQDVEHAGQFPSRFRLAAFEPPPEEAVFDVETASGARLRYAWGRLGAVAPDHPGVLAQTNLTESSYCLGRECYTERQRCDALGECYFERAHCSLPVAFDARDDASTGCRQVATGGDVAAIPGSPEGYVVFEEDECGEASCARTYEWCRDAPDGMPCQQRADGSCHPPPEDCFSRTVVCDQGGRAAPALPELDASRWMERDDLSNCGVVSRQGNLDYAANPSEWLAGLSDDAYIVYVPEGFDAAAFEELLGAPPEQAGFSVLVLEPWGDENLAAYESCQRRVLPALFDAYNAAHGTSFSVADGVDASSELGGQSLLAMARCSREVRGHWQPRGQASDLTLEVDVPPAFE